MQSCLLPAQQMQFLLIHPSPSREFKESACGGSYRPLALKFKPWLPTTAPGAAPAPSHEPGVFGLGEKRDVKRNLLLPIQAGMARAREKSRKGLGGEEKASQRWVRLHLPEGSGSALAPVLSPRALLMSPHCGWGENASPHPSLQEGPVLQSGACLPQTDGWQTKMQRPLRD